MIDAQTIEAAIPLAVTSTQLEGLGERHQGKVRDLYLQPGRRVLVATDRLSAFDHVLSAIPFKGQVLNQLSAWWFEQTRDLVANHVLDVPDPAVTIGRECTPLPVEIVVRGWITGVTGTSLWVNYSEGRDPYGLKLPAGLRKNDPLPVPVVTPTTKGDHGAHDEPLSVAEVAARGLVDPALWDRACEVALALYRRGAERAAQAGMVLVDTKYEMGLLDGDLVLIDEIHTPDSSRYWIADEAEAARAEGRDPEGLDKEYVRRWLRGQGYRGDGPPPALTPEVVVELARRYIGAFESLTGQTFDPADYPAEPRIKAALEPYRLQP